MKKYSVFAIGALVLAGCTSTGVDSSNDEDQVSAVEVEIPQKVSPAEAEIAIRNANFSYEACSAGRSFRVLNPNATLRDLANFAMNNCYRGYLRKKMTANMPLSAEDGVLLSFVINAQMTTVDTFSVALLGDMTRPGFLHDFLVQCEDRSRAFNNDTSNPEILRQQNTAFDQLKRNFLNDHGGLRGPMREWASAYSVINEDAVKVIFNSVCSESESATLYEAGVLEKHPWLWSGGMMVLGGGLLTGSAWTISALSPDRKTELEEQCSRFRENGRETSEKWYAVRDALTTYEVELKEMMNDMRAYTKSKELTDSEARQRVEDALRASSKDYSGVSRYLDYAIYDLPFVMQTLKAGSDLKDCQGFFDDDEEKMKEVMARYMVSVCDKEMLKRIRTVYGASAYEEVIKLFKKELTERDFNSFVRITRLYNISRENKDPDGNNQVSPLQ